MYGWRRDHDESFHAGASATMSAASQQQQGQWGQEETRELIRIRGDMERDSAASKRSKALWEAVSAAMLGRGFSRTPDQCKCKWKNLLNRYKVTHPFHAFAFTFTPKTKQKQTHRKKKRFFFLFIGKE